MIAYVLDFLGLSNVPADSTIYHLIVVACLVILVSVSHSIIKYITLPIELLVARYKSK